MQYLRQIALELDFQECYLGAIYFGIESKPISNIAPSLGAPVFGLWDTALGPSVDVLQCLLATACFPMRIPQGIGTRHREMDF